MQFLLVTLTALAFATERIDLAQRRAGAFDMERRAEAFDLVVHAECPEERKVRVFVDGVYDLVHLGHWKSWAAARKAASDLTHKPEECMHLIVGIGSDEQCFVTQFSKVMRKPSTF